MAGFSSKDKLAYPLVDEQGQDFDHSHYYYNRDGGASGLDSLQQGGHGGFHNQFVGSSPYGVGSVPPGQLNAIQRGSANPSHIQSVGRNIGLSSAGVVGADNGQLGRASGAPNMYLRGNESMPFDTSNFPVLSGNSNRANLSGLTQPQATQSEDFNLMSEDFPALPGSNKATARDQADASSGEKLVGAANVGSLVSDGSGNAPSVNKDAKYGLAGLLDVIKMTDREMNILALGSDLTTFGLNLNSAECLFSSFSSPFADQPSSAEPPYSTPNCYMIRPPQMKIEHLSKYSLETLFYMFYAMPKDYVQALAAQELYRREWRYHGELKVWLKARSPQEIMHSHQNVQYLQFEINSWESRLFTTPYRGNLAAGLLTEEDIRVKLVMPSAAAAQHPPIPPP